MNLPFPLIRHLSNPISRLLLKLPITPNQITTASLTLGLCGCLFFANGKFEHTLLASFFFLIAYILDNCDGEIARKKNLSSSFGAKYDTFADWLLHFSFFIGLGIGSTRQTENETLIWLGLLASLGATINYVIGLYFNQDNSESETTQPAQPEAIKEYFVYIYRELFRADFCFIVAILAILDFTWILLPAGAMGAQIYWIMFLMSHNKSYHV